MTRVATQGRNGYDQWVTKYRLQYSSEEENFQVYREPGVSSVKGNNNFLVFYSGYVSHFYYVQPLKMYYTVKGKN